MRHWLWAIVLACAAGCGSGVADHVGAATQPPADMAGASPANQSPAARVSFHMTGVQ